MSAPSSNPACSLLSRLQAFSCPYVVGYDDDWLLTQLLEPSELRVKVLLWALEMIEPSMLVSADSKNKSKELLSVLSALGFCSSDRMDLVKGTASKRDQLQLYTLLLDIVEVASSFSSPSELDSEWTQQKEFIYQLSGQPGCCNQLLSTKVDLLPPPIKARITSAKRLSTKPIASQSLVRLVKKAEGLSKALQVELTQKSEELVTIKEKYIYYEFTSEEVRQLCESVDSVVTALNCHLSQWLSCYDGELVSWCHLPDTHTSPLGLILERLDNKMDHVATILQTWQSVCGSGDTLRELHCDLRSSLDPILTSLRDYLSGLPQSAADQVLVGGTHTVTAPL